MAEVLHTRRFRERFLRCLSRRPRSLRFAVPYVGRTPYGPVADFGRQVLAQGCEDFQIVTRPPVGSDGVMGAHEAELLVAMGVNLVIRDRWLHSKIYQFVFGEGDRAAFVGSANFTAGGFERNDETVAFLTEAGDNDAVEAELDRLAGPGAAEFGVWKVRSRVLGR